MNSTGLLIFIAAVVVLAIIEKLFLNYEPEYLVISIYVVPLAIIILISTSVFIFYPMDMVNIWLAAITGGLFGFLAQYITHRNRKRTNEEIRQLQGEIEKTLGKWGGVNGQTDR